MVSFLTVADIIGPISSRSGKKTSKAPTWLSGSRIDGEHARVQGLVGLQHHLARARVDDVGDGEGALQVGLGDLDLLHLQLLHLLRGRRR